MSELYHHGVLGQKWGVRRYQNKDGSLTAVGKKRKAELTFEEKKKLSPGKAAKAFTDEELEKVVRREKLETEYQEARYKQMEMGRQRTDRVLKVVGTVAVASIGVASVTVGKEAVKKMGSELGAWMAKTITESVTNSMDSAKTMVKETASKAVSNVAKEATKSATKVVNSTGHLTGTQKTEFRQQAIAAGRRAMNAALNNHTVADKSAAKELAKKVAKEEMERLLKTVIK